MKNYLSENDKINIQLKTFFKNNIYILNNNSFLTKFLDILFKEKEYFLMFSVFIFIDLPIFSLLEQSNQNLILINLKLLFKKKEEILNESDPLKQYYKEKIYKEEDLNLLLLSKLLDKLINLMLYHPLSKKENNENNNESQLDIVIDIISIILEKKKI